MRSPGFTLSLLASASPLAVATDLDAGLFRGWFEQVVPWTAGYASWFERKFVHPGAKPMSRSSSNANMYGAADVAEAGVTEVLRKSPTTV